VARAHFGAREEVFESVLEAYKNVRASRAPDQHEPSLAEFLDAVAAVVALGPDDPRWQGIVEYTLSKPGPR
jgi:hypothetical protein